MAKKNSFTGNLLKGIFKSFEKELLKPIKKDKLSKPPKRRKSF